MSAVPSSRPYKIDTGSALIDRVRALISAYPFLNSKVFAGEGDSVRVSAHCAGLRVEYLQSLLGAYKTRVVRTGPRGKVSVDVLGSRPLTGFSEYQKRGVIGSTDQVDIPLLELRGVAAKVDTGATCSSLHCEELELSSDEKTVRFVALSPDHAGYTGKPLNMKVVDTVAVQSSNGTQQSRPLVQLTLVVQGQKCPGYTTLANREELEFPLLLGRDILGRFLIDSSR